MSNVRDLSRRGFLRITGAASLLTACAPAAAPSGGPGAAAPAAAPDPGAQPRPAWEGEWERLVAAAKQEGRLGLMTLVGPGYRKGIDAFQAAFPGIEVEQSGFVGASAYIPKINEERKAGIYSFDVAQTSLASMISQVKPTGALDPIRPAIFRPDVVEDKNWRGGFEQNFADLARQVVFMFGSVASSLMHYNADLVKPDEIKSFNDLLNPKWRERIILADVGVGNTYTPMAAVRKALGDEPVKRFIIDQKPTFSRDTRQITEAMVRGQYAIATGVVESLLSEFQSQGLGRQIKRLDVPEARNLNSSSGLMLFNRAPHPNAAKLFINWILTKQAQELWCKATEQNSHRADVAPSDPETAPLPGAFYLNTQLEGMVQIQDDARKFLQDLVK